MRRISRVFVRLFLVFLLFFFLVGNASAVLSFNIDKTTPQNLYGNLDQDDINPGGQFMCGPTAVVNSYVYLQNTYPTIYNSSLIGDADGDGDSDDYQDMIQVALNLAGAGYMNTKNNAGAGSSGTYDDMLIYGKYKYIEDNLPNQTVYAAELASTWGWVGARLPGEIPPIAKPGWVQDQTSPTYNFITSELISCEDVEILINWTDPEEGLKGHFLTVTGFHWIDADGDLIVDLVEGAMIDYIDPGTGLWAQSPIWQVGNPANPLDVLYGGNQTQVTMAVAESPVPEPGSLLLLGLGTLAWRRRRS